MQNILLKQNINFKKKKNQNIHLIELIFLDILTVRL